MVRPLASNDGPGHDVQALSQRIMVLGCLASMVGFTACAEIESESKPTSAGPVAVAPTLANLALKIRPEGSDLGREVGAALGTELARAGVSILTDDRLPADAELRLFLDLRSLGLVVEGVT